ncbi:MAG: hypothetical protein U0491_01725 [Candidatus Saccharimonadales bacterium]
MRKHIYATFLLVLLLVVPISTVIAEQEMNGTVDSRLSKAVSDQQITLDDAAKSTISVKCANAQQQLAAIKEKTSKQVQLRIDTYSDIQKELQAIKLRMARQGVDASEIDLLVGKVQQHLDSVTLAASNYGSSLDDITQVDCAQKPEQFMAGLFIARVKQKQLYKEANELKSTMNTADTSTFNQLKKRLTVN